MALATLAGIAAWRWPPTAAERAGWLRDYDLLRSSTGEAYANLGDRLQSRHLSPRELDTRTRERLARAHDVTEARAALQSFVAAFDDNHFKARAPLGLWQKWQQRRQGKGQQSDPRPLPPTLPGVAACARLGYNQQDRGELAWATLPNWRTLGGGTAQRPFFAGLVPSSNPAVQVAVLRISLFSGEAFPALCAAQWEEYHRTLDAPCDADCVDRFALRVEFALLDRLAAQVLELRRAGAGALLVDVTGNGGGSSMVNPLARELSMQPLREPELGFIRHVHWEKQFAETRDAFEQELKRADLTPTQRTLLSGARAQAESMRSEAARHCDLSRLWTQSTPKLPCQPLGHFAGYLRYVQPGGLEGLKTKGHLFGPSQYPYQEGAWTGPLLVLMDRWTASAAEEFAALLKDNGAAILVGERTLGIGCGYTNGGVVLNLPDTGLTVRMPDCVRYRADGRSEAEGISPDRRVLWISGDDGPARARKALAALPL